MNVGERGAVFLVATGALVVMWMATVIFPKQGTTSAGDGAGFPCEKIDARAILTSWRTTIDTTRRMADDFIRPSIFVHVWTEKWKAAGHDGQMSIAIAAYCTVADKGGKGIAIIKGSLGESLAGVVDGQYADG
jgi:hypothetical protein